MKIFRFVSALHTVWGIGAASLSVLILFLSRTIFGALLTTLFLYIFAKQITGVAPFSFDDLLLWLHELPVEAKSGVFTSMITVVGFLVAFRSGAMIWRTQARDQLKLEAARELEQFFSEADSKLTGLEIYANELLKILSIAKENPLDGRLKGDHAFLFERSAVAIETRARLSDMGVEVFRLQTKHHAVINSVWGASSTLDKAIRSFDELTDAIWISIPIRDDRFSDPLSNIIRMTDEKKTAEFVRLCDQKQAAIQGIVGGVRALLLAPILGFNATSLANFARQRQQVKAIADEVAKKSNL